jgi:hypothetical protein
MLVRDTTKLIFLILVTTGIAKIVLFHAWNQEERIINCLPELLFEVFFE